MILQWIAAPLLGGVIGYITNDIAIKMLFHPRKPLYIGTFHVPFTPGLIPQQRNRIAASIGEAVSVNLLDPMTLRETLLSDETLQNLTGKLTEALEKLQKDTRTVEQLLLSMHVSADQIGKCKEAVRTHGTDLLMKKISDAQVGAFVENVVIEEATQKFGRHIAATLSSLGVGEALGKLVEHKIQEDAPTVIDAQIGKLEEDILSMRLCELYEKHNQRIPAIAEEGARLYKQALESNLDRALRELDIAGIVEKKIQSFDAKELEDLILGLMRRELRAIVLLGALLGFLMGFINLLFQGMS